MLATATNNIGMIPLDKNRERKIVFYGRVSTEHEAQLSALQNQLQWYDDQLRYHPNWTLVDKYIDEGITGTQAKKRPAFLKMIADAQKGKFDLIVTREVCRFARNTVDTLLYTRKLKSEFGIEVFFVEDNIWTMDGDGELRLSLMATLAQEESRKTSERVRAGQKISRDNGVLYGSGNILGYDRQGDHYVINEEQAETVRMIFDMYLSGMGSMKIAKELNTLKRKNATGDIKWSAEKVLRILKKSTYKGVLAYGQSFSNNYLEQKRVNNLNRDTYMYQEIEKIPPIISIETWEAVQKIINEHSQTLQGQIKRGKKPVNEFWSKKLICGCGSSMRRNKWRTNKKTGEEVFGYQCQHQLNYGSKSFREKQGLDTEGYCGVRMVADWKLDMMAKSVIQHIWKEQSESLLLSIQMIIDNYVDDKEEAKVNTKEIQLKIDKLEKRLKNLIEMRADGEITKEEYAEMKEDIGNRISELKSELIVDTVESDNPKLLKEKMEIIARTLAEVIDFEQPKLPESVVGKFIDKVQVLDDNHFKWYLCLDRINGTDTVDFDPDDYENSTIETEIEGRKGKATSKIVGFKNSLCCFNSSTGSYQQQIINQ